MSDSRAIGVFDSGVGGLTVVRALSALLPKENICYLGDTARLPYGTKSKATIQKYTLQISRCLLAYDIKIMVVACNSASANALALLQKSYAQLPVIGMIAPGAAVAAQQADKHILVLATEATMLSGAYEHSIKTKRPDVRVTVLACPVLVALAEAGWTTGAAADAAVATYLDAGNLQGAPDTLLLGCTHFPLLADCIRASMPTEVRLIDSAQAVAAQVQALLTECELLSDGGGEAGGGKLKLLVTDEATRFARTGRYFLGANIALEKVEVLDL